MLSNLFGGRCRIRALRDGPSGALLERFAHKLCDLRYAARTCRRHLRSAEHFIDWTNRQGLSVSDVNAQVLERFGRHVGRCRCRSAHGNQIHVLNGARMLAMYLRDAHVIAASALEQEVSADPVLLSDFRAWMHRQRGTCAATLSNYARPIRELLDRVGQAPSQWDVHQLRAFVLERSHSTGGKHTCALTVLQATKDLRKVSLWLGHAHMHTTEIYTRANNPSVTLEALESMMPPKLRSGRFKATDKLIASLTAHSVMCCETSSR
jgi:hypothetical protein